jgi:plasmid stabilization system protein ParE
MELRRAVARYDVESPGVGDQLVAEVEAATARIADFPEHGSPYLAGTRRAILPRFPFSVVYRVDRDGALIVAIAHHRRRPGYWQTRRGASPG